jgi:hypothetical protein
VRPRNAEFRGLFLLRRKGGTGLLLRLGFYRVLSFSHAELSSRLVTSVGEQLSRQFSRAAIATATTMASTKL